MTAKTKRQEVEEHAHRGAATRERASSDYERPTEDVGEMPDPVKMPTNKARAGETGGHMRTVLTIGIILTLAGYLIGYYLFYT